jgi:predicted dehydrogenase
LFGDDPSVAAARAWQRGEIDRLIEATLVYVYQLEAFRDAIRDGAPVPTDAAAAVSQMRTLDAIYQAAGMPARP